MKHKTKLRLEKKYKSWYNIIARHVFNDFYYNRGLTETCARIKKYSGVIQKMHNYLEWEAMTKWGDKPDDRAPEDVYGYKSLESIEGNLSYISDRFAAEFRLRWLLKVPEYVEKLQNAHIHRISPNR
jgi:hypothetical protein